MSWELEERARTALAPHTQLELCWIRAHQTQQPVLEGSKTSKVIRMPMPWQIFVLLSMILMKRRRPPKRCDPSGVAGEGASQATFIKVGPHKRVVEFTEVARSRRFEAGGPLPSLFQLPSSEGALALPPERRAQRVHSAQELEPRWLASAHVL
eukprot:631383-Amphidinium_carterae.2